MKKMFTLITGFMLILLLAACGSSDPVDQTNDEKENQTETAPEPMTVEEVFAETAKASEELQSFVMNMNLDQEISSEAAEETLNLTSAINMEVVTDPISFYQKMTMEMQGTEESFQTESYFSQDGFYMQDPTSGSWMKFPTEMSDQLLQLSDQQTNPMAELEKLQEFVEDITMEENEGSYVLKLSASGEGFNELIQETIAQTLPEEMTADAEAMQNINISAVDYEIIVDKETFFPSKMDISMDMEMTVEGETVQLSQQVSGEYLDYNTLEAITIPQEIIDHAVEMEF